ncbi:hypothetical protein Cni_G04511 [Canna indica]|uniref:IQ domain-containing protein IQM2-like n=1 Tax=Canna indica TaxID=4628 RepID=A0AAQ3JVI8_9LILI|nr:hypothetical protein Cni_G04511 [Canna indica]
MPISVSYQESGDNSTNKSLKTLITRSLSFTGNARSILRSASLKSCRDSDNVETLQSTGKLMIKGSLSFNNRGQMQPFRFETMISVVSPKSEEQKHKSPPDESKASSWSPLLKEPQPEPPQSPFSGVDSPKHEAALKLQKVYKSFRTRRQLADCAIIVEQQWWKLIDFALLKSSSVSFFEKQESAVSRWSRARTRAAKVGKGLSKDEKAQKLALQHWLEAIDPRHRYGHNLQFYYDHWLQCKSMQPFFYWLDVGEGKEINLQEQCNRSKLQQQCIMYLGPRERETYQATVEDGIFMYKESMQLVNTCDGPKDEKWIFVLSTSKNLYIGRKRRGKFQHSSFLAGGATSAAGRLVVENGILKAVWPHSGHYRPTNDNFKEFMNFLEQNGVDLTDVRKSPGEGDDDLCGGLISSSSELNLADKFPQTEADDASVAETICNAKREADRDALSDDDMNNSKQESTEDEANNSRDSRRIQEQKVSKEQQENNVEEAMAPSELLLRRIKSKKATKSYQLGTKVSFKWADGTGPRIACVREYPSALQCQALEQVSLSPRTPPANLRFPSPRPSLIQIGNAKLVQSSPLGLSEGCRKPMQVV